MPRQYLGLCPRPCGGWLRAAIGQGTRDVSSRSEARDNTGGGWLSHRIAISTYQRSTRADDRTSPGLQRRSSGRLGGQVSETASGRRGLHPLRKPAHPRLSGRSHDPERTKPSRPGSASDMTARPYHQRKGVPRSFRPRRGKGMIPDIHDTLRPPIQWNLRPARRPIVG